MPHATAVVCHKDATELAVDEYYRTTKKAKLTSSQCQVVNEAQCSHGVLWLQGQQKLAALQGSAVAALTAQGLQGNDDHGG